MVFYYAKLDDQRVPEGKRMSVKEKECNRIAWVI